MKKRITNINVEVAQALDKEIVELAKKIGTGKSAIVRRCIRVGLEEIKNNPARFIAEAA